MSKELEEALAWAERSTDPLFKALAAEVGRLRTALAFYASIGSWENDTVEAAGAPVNVPFTAAVFSDIGQLARNALLSQPIETQVPNDAQTLENAKTILLAAGYRFTASMVEKPLKEIRNARAAASVVIEGAQRG